MSDWPNYLIRQDFTARGKDLAKIPVGLLDEGGQRMISAILSENGIAEDKDKWSISADSTDYSLNGVEVVYNGVNKYSLPTFSFFKYALGLKFPARSTGPTGYVYLCWYEPSDEEVDITPPGPGAQPIDEPGTPPEDEPETPVTEEE